MRPTNRWNVKRYSINSRDLLDELLKNSFSWNFEFGQKILENPNNLADNWFCARAPGVGVWPHLCRKGRVQILCGDSWLLVRWCLYTSQVAINTIKQQLSAMLVWSTGGHFTSYQHLVWHLLHWWTPTLGLSSYILIIWRNYNIQNINYYCLLWFSYQFM